MVKQSIVRVFFSASFLFITPFVFGQGIIKAINAPAAVPVISLREAKDANEEALKFAPQENVRGKIIALTHTISPETAAYENCNFVLALGDDNGNEYVLTVPMFVNRKFTAFAQMKVGDILDVQIIPFEEASKEIHEIQTIDDINDFEKDMYYADTIYEQRNHFLSIDPKNKEIWLKKMLQETELQLVQYEKLISKNKDERDKEINEYRRTVFHAKQKSNGYFVDVEPDCVTSFYSPTLLEGIIDISKVCKSHNCELIVVPTCSIHEYSRKELLNSLKDFPFIDYGREKLVYDCLKNGILAVDTNKIICEHQSEEYLPFSLLGDNHFSLITNLYIADEIATNLGIKRNEFKIKKDIFHLNSIHVSHYTGPREVLSAPEFDIPFSGNKERNISIFLIGDSGVNTNNLNGIMSSLTLCNTSFIRHDAGADTSLKEVLEGQYDFILEQSSLVLFVLYAPYMKNNYPTKELVDLTTKIKRNEIPFYTVPDSKSNTIIIKRPISFSQTKPLPVLLEPNAIISQFTISCQQKQLFDYNCDYRFLGGSNSFLIHLDPDLFVNDQAKLHVNGNISFKKIILVDSP